MIFHGERREIGDWRDDVKLAHRTITDKRMLAWAIDGVVEERRYRTAAQDAMDAIAIQQVLDECAALFTEDAEAEIYETPIDLNRLGGINSPERRLMEKGYDAIITLAAISEKQFTFGQHSHNFRAIPEDRPDLTRNDLATISQSIDLLVLNALDMVWNSRDLVDLICDNLLLSDDEKEERLINCIDLYSLRDLPDLLGTIAGRADSARRPEWMDNATLAAFAVKVVERLEAGPMAADNWTGRPIVDGFSYEDIESSIYNDEVEQETDGEPRTQEWGKFNAIAFAQIVTSIAEAVLCQQEKIPLEWESAERGLNDPESEDFECADDYETLQTRVREEESSRIKASFRWQARTR